MNPQINGIPQCILDLIEFLPCEDSTSRVGVHRLTDIPEISSEMLGNIATSDHPTATKVFESALRYVTSNLLVTLRTFAAPFITPLLSSTCLCKPPAIPSSFLMRHPINGDGLRIDFVTPQEAIKKLSTISVWVDTVGPVELIVKEGTKETPITINVARANWWQEHTLNYVLAEESNSIEIYFVPTTAYKVGFYDCLKTTSSGCCGSKTISKDAPVSRYATVTGKNILGDQKQIAGIRPCVKIDCDPVHLFCMFADMLTPAVVSLVAAKLLRDAARSTNVNITTLQDPSEQWKYSTGYEKVAKTYLDNVKLLINDYAMHNPSGCFRCDQESTSAWAGH